MELNFEIEGIKVSKYFNDGYIYGTINALTNKLSRFNVRANSELSMLVMEKEKFFQIINKYSAMK